VALLAILAVRLRIFVLMDIRPPGTKRTTRMKVNAKTTRCTSPRLIAKISLKPRKHAAPRIGPAMVPRPPMKVVRVGRKDHESSNGA
jgi:hypothetical protein